MFQQVSQTVKEMLVYNMAQKLLKPNNTITNLEIKNQLIKDFSNIKWTQDFIHVVMDNFRRQGLFVIIADNGTYRTYSDPNYDPLVVDVVALQVDPVSLGVGSYTKTVDISNNTIATVNKTTIDTTKALDLMKNNRGHYFTAFINEDATKVVLNCQYINSQNDAITVRLRKKSGNPIYIFDLNKLVELSINKQFFVISNN